MNINIILGKCNEQNNECVFSLLRNRDKSKKHIIIAPDRSLFSIESRIFDELDESCFFDVRVMSISKLAKEIMPKTTKNILTKQSGVALVKKLLKENEKDLKSFGKCSDKLGFASSLFETICLYKSCNIKPNEVYVDDSTSYSNLKQNDIKLIYTKYEEYFKNDFTDSFNQLIAFASMINSEIFKDTIFYLVEFDDFTALMYNIIAKMSKFSEAIYITCTYNKDGRNRNIYLNKVYYDLISLFKSMGVYYNQIIPDKSGDDFTNNLIGNLFSYDNIDKLPINKNRIKISSFNTIHDEVRYIIADIYSKAMNDKISFDKFAIVTPSIIRYKKSLLNEFKNYNMSYYFDENQILSNHAIIQLIFSITNLLDNFNLADFMNVLKSPILNFGEDKVCDIDNKLKEIDARMSTILKFNYDDNDIAKFVELLISCRDKNNEDFGEKYLNEIIIAIYNFIVGRYEKYINSLDSLQSRILNQVVTKFESICNDFISVFGKEKFNKLDFIEVFKSYFESTNISLPPITSNTIFVADLDGSYLSKYDYIYMLGCNEGIMPSFKVDNGIVTDDDIDKLPNGNKITPTITMINKRKLFKVFDTIFRCRKVLNLTYVLSENGGSLFPNSLVNSLTRNFDVKVNNLSKIFEIENYTYRLDQELFAFSNLTTRVIKRNLISMMKNWDLCSEFPIYRKVVSTLAGVVREDADRFIQALTQKIKYQDIRSINLLNKEKISISQIQNFYKCPYKHFIEYGLRLKELELSKIEPVDIGNIIHNSLKLVVGYIIRNKDGEKEKLYEFANKTLDNVLRNQYEKFLNNISNRFVIKSLRKEFVRIVNAINFEINNSSFSPSEKLLEVSFRNAITIDGISIDGAIDRVDTLNDKFIIIDYKTGDSSFDDYGGLYYGKKLQLLLYANAYENVSGKNCIGAFYMPITNEFGSGVDKSYKFNGVMIGSNDNIIAMDNNLVNSGYDSKIIHLKKSSTKDEYNSNSFKNYMCLSESDFRYILDFATNKVKEAIARIKVGEISPRPLVDGMFSSCNRCKYKSLCHYNGDNDETIEKIQSVDILKNKIEGVLDGVK